MPVMPPMLLLIIIMIIIAVAIGISAGVGAAAGGGNVVGVSISAGADMVVQTVGGTGTWDAASVFLVLSISRHSFYPPAANVECVVDDPSHVIANFDCCGQTDLVDGSAHSLRHLIDRG